MSDRRLTARGRARRRQIIAYASEQFAAQGYDPTSVADIVDGIGVGKGVFYWYFESKEHLLVEILDEAQRDYVDALHAAVAPVVGAVARLDAAIRATVAWQAAHRSVASIRRFAAGEARFSHAMRRNHEAIVAEWIGLIREGIADGTVRSDHPVMLANAIIGVTTSFDRVFLTHGTDPQVVADVAVRFCLDGLADASASAPSLRAL